MAETLKFDMRLTSKICEGGLRWRNRVLCGHFKTFICKLLFIRVLANQYFLFRPEM